MNASEKSGKLYIGTSGWSYKHWKGVFYPENLSQNKWLEYYAEHFETVEINNSFYRLPKRETFESWRSNTPPGFVFAVKASRYITHLKKLKGVEESLGKFLGNARGLGEKLGPILFQFPANWHTNPERLNDFTRLLPDGLRYAFEFRHESWFNDKVYKILKSKDAAIGIADSPDWPTTYEITASFTFIRMHGGRKLYASEYSTPELSQWAQIVKRFIDKEIDVYVYFNNDARAYAVKNAIQLRRLILKDV